MTPINGQRLFFLNDQDIWAGEDLESCVIEARDFGREVGECRELTDGEVNRSQEFDTGDTSLAIELRSRLKEGMPTPILFAQTEVAPEPKEVEVIQPMMMLPASPGTCPICATAHEPFLPHNLQSLFYGVRFQGLHGRSPTWADAAAHCTESVRDQWMQVTAKMGHKWSAPRTGDPIAERPENASPGMVMLKPLGRTAPELGAIHQNGGHPEHVPAPASQSAAGA